MSVNRRRAPRFSVNLSVTVITEAAAGTIAFVTKNISATGLLVQSPQGFGGTVGDEFKLTIFLDRARQESNISFQARIVHQDTSDHIHGMEITTIAEGESVKLIQFIENIAESQPHLKLK